MIAESKEDKLLTAALSDKLRQCEDKMYPTNSGFLDAREQAVAHAFLHKNCANYLFWGGFAQAERRCVIFLPDYLDIEALKGDFNQADEEIKPLVVLRVTPTVRAAGLSHRDYLGSVLAMGINRNKVGDIIVTDNGADIVIMRDIADYLLLNYSQAGRHQLSARLISTAELSAWEPPAKEIAANVPSLRLDCVASAAFGISRSKCAEVVQARLIAVNGLQISKPDQTVKPEDSITWRGKGKAKLLSVDGKSRKERIFITIKRYI